MKQAAASVFVIWGIIFGAAGCNSRQSPDRRTMQFDLGRVLPGKTTKTTARLVNQEGFALRLLRAETTCGCLKMEVRPTEITPGGEAVATLTLAIPKREGAFQQRASLVFAGRNDQEIVYTLFIRGTTMSWISADPAVVDFGRHMLGERCLVSTQLQSPEPIATSELEIECSNPLVSARLLDGESETDKTLEVSYDTTKSTNNPECQGYIRIHRKKTDFSYNLPYKAVFDSLYKVAPDHLSLGIVGIQKPVILPLHFTSSKLDLTKGHWQIDGVPEGLKAKILSEKCEKGKDISDQTIRIQVSSTKPGIRRGLIVLQNKHLQLRLELPCSLMTRDAK